MAEVIDASGPQPDSVDTATVLTILAGRQLFRVLTEGGPSLLGLLIENDLLDELCVTIAPILVGGSARRIATGPGQVHTKMRRTHLLTDDDGYLYTRYVKGGWSRQHRPARAAADAGVSNVVSMRRRRLVQALGTSAVVMSTLLAGCAPGLAANPRFATDAGARPQGAPQTTTPPPGPAADRSAEERPVLAGLHVAGIQ